MQSMMKEWLRKCTKKWFGWCKRGTCLEENSTRMIETTMFVSSHMKLSGLKKSQLMIHIT